MRLAGFLLLKSPSGSEPSKRRTLRPQVRSPHAPVAARLKRWRGDGLKVLVGLRNLLLGKDRSRLAQANELDAQQFSNDCSEVNLSAVVLPTSKVLWGKQKLDESLCGDTRVRQLLIEFEACRG